MRKLLSLILIGVLTLGVSAAAWAGSIYPDVKSGHWAEKDIAKMKAKGIVAGLSDGYHPNDPVTREQAVVMIVKAIGKGNEVSGKKLPANFKNADKVSSWAKESVALAVQEGIVSGSDLADFRPKDATKRFEMAVFIGRALGYTSADFIGTEQLYFTDASKIPSAAKGFVAAVVDEDMMSGLNDGTFRPGDSLSRAQMASLLANLDNKLDKLSSSSLQGEVFSVSSTSNSLLVKDSSGLIQTVTLTKDAYIYKNKSVTLSGLARGDKVLLITNSKGESSYIEVVKNDAPSNTQQAVSGTIKTVVAGAPASVTLKHSAGETSYTVDSTAELLVDNKTATTLDLAAGQEVTAVVQGGKILKLTGRNIERELTGEIKLITRGTTVTVKVSESNGSENSYTLGSLAKVYLDFKETTSDDLFVGQKVTITVKGKEVSKVYATSLEWQAEGTLVSVAFAPAESITIKDENGKTQTYNIIKDARVRRNSSTVSLRDLVPGDEIELELKNNKVSYIYAKKVELETEGRVKALTIASTSTITIETSSNKEETYKISVNAVIERDDRRIDIGGIKVGDYVTLDVEGEMAVRMEVEARSSLSYIIGKIDNINTTAKVLVLRTANENDQLQQVFLSSGTYIIKFDDDISISSLKIGDEVIAVGKYESGLFMVSTVVVVGSSN